MGSGDEELEDVLSVSVKTVVEVHEEVNEGIQQMRSLLDPDEYNLDDLKAFLPPG